MLNFQQGFSNHQPKMHHDFDVSCFWQKFCCWCTWFTTAFSRKIWCDFLRLPSQIVVFLSVALEIPIFTNGMAGHGALRKLRLWLLLFLRGEPRFWPMNWNRFQRFYKRWEAVSAGHISCLARDFMGICEIQEVVIQCYSVIQQSSMTGDRNETKYTRSGWIIRDSRFCSDSLTAVLDLNSRKPGAGSRGDRKNVPNIWMNLITTSLRTPLEWWLGLV